MFAFTSPGSKIDRTLNTGKGPPSFRIQGQNHHLIGSLLPVLNPLHKTGIQIQMHLTMLPMSLRIFNRPHPFFFFGQQQTTPFEGPDQIIIGNGQGLNINFSGVTSFKSPFNSQIPLVLNSMLFVPSITKNLMRSCSCHVFPCYKIPLLQRMTKTLN